MRRTMLTVLLILATGCGRPSAGQEARRSAADALPAPAPHAAWDVAVEPDSTPVIRHRGSPVVTALWHGWQANWQYAGGNVRRDGDAVTGGFEGLGLTVGGGIEPGDGALKHRYVFTAAAARQGDVGVCLEWHLRLDAPSLAGAGEPELLDGNRGWRWPTADGPIEVRFDPAVAGAYFERGQKHTLRTFFLTDSIAAGRHAFAMTVQLPPGGKVARAPGERYSPPDLDRWTTDPLPFDQVPVDLSFLNEKPAGQRGFVRAQVDGLVFADGTPARFWGGNLAAYALFVPDDEIAVQARRIAALGYNLMRLHHHDSTGWVSPTVIDKGRPDTATFDVAGLDRLDRWVAALKAEGVYVWLDLHVGRQFKPGDGPIPGWDEVARRDGEAKGFCYYNEVLEERMRAFQEAYLNHVNPHTGLAYKADPAIMGLLVTNENDLTHHFGNLMLGDKGNPHHNALFEADVDAFAQRTGLPRNLLGQTWLAGPAKIYLNDREARFHQRMLDHLAGLGVQVPVATTNFWGNGGLYTLPALSIGGIVDVHSYGGAEALSSNPLFDANYITWIGGAQLADRPLSISEWNTPYPTVDRFTAPLYVAAIASLQGWDAPMVYNYSQDRFGRPDRAREWSTFMDPAITGAMPAAAVAYRQGHIAGARRMVHLALTRETAYLQGLNPENTRAIRTLVEQSKLTVGLPDLPELDWDRDTAAPADAEVVEDPQQSFLADDATRVVADTGQIARDWVQGVQVIDAPATQSVAGWIGGQEFVLNDLRVRVDTPKAVIIATSLDSKPLRESRRILVTALARQIAVDGRTPFRGEPVTGRISLRCPAGLEVTAPLGAAPTTRRQGDWLELDLTGTEGTHWFIVE